MRPSPLLYSAASFAMFCGVLACVGILSVFQNGGGNATQIVGGFLLIVSSSIVLCGDRCVCHPMAVVYTVSSAILCHVASLIFTAVLTLPWWNRLNEWNLGWVNGLIVYGMVIDVLCIVAAVVFLCVLSRGSRRRADRRRATTGPPRRVVSRATIRSGAR